MIPPTVGRSIWYYPGFHESTMKTGDGQPCAAIISRVLDANTVNLAVFAPDGHACARRSIRLEQEVTEPPADNTTAYAAWMPYQIGQARMK